MNTLPIDIVNIILEFQGYHTWRYGKYMQRISNEDPRRQLLLRIPKSIKMKLHMCGTSVSMQKFIDNKEIYYHMQSFIVTNRTIWTMDTVKYYDNDKPKYRDSIQFTW